MTNQERQLPLRVIGKGQVGIPFDKPGETICIIDKLQEIKATHDTGIEAIYVRGSNNGEEFVGRIAWRDNGGFAVYDIRGSVHDSGTMDKERFNGLSFRIGDSGRIGDRVNLKEVTEVVFSLKPVQNAIADNFQNMVRGIK